MGTLFSSWKLLLFFAFSNTPPGFPHSISSSHSFFFVVTSFSIYFFHVSVCLSFILWRFSVDMVFLTTFSAEIHPGMSSILPVELRFVLFSDGSTSLSLGVFLRPFYLNTLKKVEPYIFYSKCILSLSLTVSANGTTVHEFIPVNCLETISITCYPLSPTSTWMQHFLILLLSCLLHLFSSSYPYLRCHIWAFDYSSERLHQ